MLKRILFVDDEQEVLEGLQHTLRPMRCPVDVGAILTTCSGRLLVVLVVQGER
jgi:hypothetical protein